MTPHVRTQSIPDGARTSDTIAIRAKYRHPRDRPLDSRQHTPYAPRGEPCYERPCRQALSIAPRRRLQILLGIRTARKYARVGGP
ncbi:hypothetical protein ABBQ38_000559 [Trebouxia sp. C0009 RCD-2024]